MKLSITIPDDVYELYVKKYGVKQAYHYMRKAVELFKDMDETDRYLFLVGDDRRAVEAIFQTTLDSGKKLAKLCQRLQNVEISGTHVDFNTEELERLQMQATFHGKDLKTFIHDLAVEIKTQILELY